MKSIFLLILLSCFFLCDCGTANDAHELDTRKGTTVYLVRHAEKVDASADPVLSEAGEERALELAEVLGSVGIDYIHTTDFKRTRATAAPTAERYGIEPEIYHATDLPALVEKIEDKEGTHLVVGHSTTTPKMVQLLGGEGKAPINEKGEFDRLYVVKIATDGTVTSELRRYGQLYLPKE